MVVYQKVEFCPLHVLLPRSEILIWITILFGMNKEYKCGGCSG